MVPAQNACDTKTIVRVRVRFLHICTVLMQNTVLMKVAYQDVYMKKISFEWQGCTQLHFDDVA